MCWKFDVVDAETVKNNIELLGKIKIMMKTIGDNSNKIFYTPFISRRRKKQQMIFLQFFIMKVNN